ncbi:MAG: hypothetical protein IPG98_15290 [Burkholderiales bacterium]|nr:hypothetical protein [Burkholderiales bacterium]MBK8667041.1 hypothetical protein [Burkholderiales bacterium]
MYHYTFGGLRNVWLVNGYTLKKTPMGDAVAFADGEGLERAICLALTDKAGHLTGAELRFIRQSGLLMSQPALGKMIGADAQSVARWEKSGRVPKWADKLVRLVFLAHAEGNQPIRRAVDRINTVERLVQQTIVMRERQGEWTSTVKDMEADEVQPA